ncbi:MAG: glycosyltransferase family 4 protein [Gammaproteobacteria bacterium]|nr:glycosyltransferase family 4 protein [Gammaproteobacteria bacterium]
MPDHAAILVAGMTAAFLCATLLTRVVHGYASQHMLDRPKARSGHSRPIPRGGGIAIVATVLVGTLAIYCYGWLPGRVALALVAGGAAIALLGWHDDRQELSATWRLLVQTLIAGFAVAMLGGLATLDLGFRHLSLGLAGAALALVTFVWLINLYNFMDGSDGLAGVQAIGAGIAGASLAFTHDAPGLGAVALLVVAASGGFLVWNWSPARIFMGDVGSCFLGYTFALLTFAGERTAALPALTWMLPLAVFVGDATLTLSGRYLRGARCTEAHREHAYQRLLDAGYSPRIVALGLAAIHVFGLWPATWLVGVRPELLLPVIALTYLLLTVLWLLVQRRSRRA